MILAWDGCVARSVDNVEQNELLHTATGSEVGIKKEKANEICDAKGLVDDSCTAH